MGDRDAIKNLSQKLGVFLENNIKLAKKSSLEFQDL